jgi:glycine cleavage system H protein
MQQSNAIRQAKNLKKDLYFTGDHEWIDFQGSVAYTGFCPFKLKGIKAIEKIDYAEGGTLFKANDVIGSIYYAEYKIDLHIPVAGRVLSFNDALTSGNQNLLLEQPENNGWFALIVPSSPYDRNGLLMSEQYRMKTRSLW